MRDLFAMAALSLACAAVPVSANDEPDHLYNQTAAVTLPSSATGWDYIKFQPGTSLLFMARLADGLTVFDVDTMQVVTNIENSSTANGPLLLPQMNRGFIAMADGSLMTLELNSLQVLDRLHLAEGRVIKSGILDPYTNQLHFITGVHESDSIWFTIDPQTGELLRELHFPFRKMDDPASDGSGLLYAPVLLDDLVLKLDAETLQELDRWEVGCPVTKLRLDRGTARLIGACRGDDPQVFILDPETGEVTARVGIGEGVDGIAIDAERNRIITSDGEGGFLSVIERSGVDSLRLLGRVYTQNGARMMDIDQRTGRLYIVNADFTRLPDPETGELYKAYHPDSFNVREWTPQ